MAVTQRHAACLTDTGKLLLFLSVDDHRLSQARFQLGPLLPFLPQLYAQLLDLLPRGRQGITQPRRFAVNPLTTNAAFLSVATDIAIFAEEDKKRTGNPLLGGYHAHG